MILLMDPAQPNFLSKLKFFLSANKFAVILLTILSISSFGMTGFLLMPNNKKPSLPGKIAQATIIPTPTLTIVNTPTISSPSITPTPLPTALKTDPTSTWSAFVSAKYVYSIKYPPGWTVQITTQQDPKILEYVVFNPVATKAGTLSITLSYGTRTNKEALALDPQIGESVIVASVSATKKNSKDSNGNKATNVIVPFGLNTIIFNAKDAYLGLFNQMLTTLKLTK